MTKSMIRVALAVLAGVLCGGGLAAQESHQEHPMHQMGPIPTVKPEFPRLGRLQENPTGPVYGLDELERLAVAYNPTLVQATAEIRASRARQRQSGLYPNPRVGYLGEEIRGGVFGGGQHGFFVSQTFVTGGKLGLNRKIFEQEVRIAEFESEEQRYRLANGVRLAFFRVLAAQELLAAKQDLLRIAQEGVKTAHQLRNTGQADETEVLQSELEEQHLAMAVQMQENSLRQTWRALTAVVGDPGLPMGTVAGDLEAGLAELDEQALIERIATESPAVRIAGAAVNRAQAALARARRETIPDIEVRGGLQRNGELLDATGRRVGLQGFAEVGVQLYLFNRNQGNVEAARADLERTQQETRRVELVLRQRSAAIMEMYRDARIRVERYRDQLLPRARTAYELMVRRYGLMLASYPQVLLRQRTLFELQTDYITALEGLWVNSIALQGFLLTDGLEAPARAGEVDVPVREVNLPMPHVLRSME